MVGAWGVAASDDGGGSYAVTPLWGDYHYEIKGVTPLATPGSRQSGAPACGLDAALCDGAVVVGTDATREHLHAWWTNDGGRSWSGGVPLPQPSDGVGVSRVAGVLAVGADGDVTGDALAVLGRGLVYRTRDGGRTWAAVGRLPILLGGASHVTRHALLGPDGHVWATTTRNGSDQSEAFVFRSAEPAAAAFPVAAEPSGEAAPLGVTVRPNPASVAVTVAVSLAAPSALTVSVYDALGRRVATLYDGPARDTVSLSADTSAWPAGVYRVVGTAGPEQASAALAVAR